MRWISGVQLCDAVRHRSPLCADKTGLRFLPVLAIRGNDLTMRWAELREHQAGAKPILAKRAVSRFAGRNDLL